MFNFDESYTLRCIRKVICEGQKKKIIKFNPFKCIRIIKLNKSDSKEAEKEPANTKRVIRLR